MKNPIRIGTRDSELALWQAHTVERQLQDLGYQTEIVAVKSDGDLQLDRPLYELGITGIFTKTLDVALLQNRIDVAVHSMKDVPTALPQGIIQSAVLPRANVLDLLVLKDTAPDFKQHPATIATGSLRRQAQWLHRYPQHTVVDLRGNVNSRLKKLHESTWAGAVFAAAGLERLGKTPEQAITLDWMIPAPAQGAMVVLNRADDWGIQEAVSQLNDPETEICVHIERQFLRTLEGGCTAPIGAWAQYNEQTDLLSFEGVVLSLDGQKRLSVSETIPVQDWKKAGYYWAQQILKDGGADLMAEIRAQLPSNQS
jgi:hydroxymethylbilane synthase